MKQWMKIGLLSCAAATSTQLQATNYSVDGRTDAMGGAGTASADYLTGVFYNPALIAIYSRKDDAGLLLPSFGFQVMDRGGIIDDVDQIKKGLDKLPSDPVNAEREIESGLRNLNGDALSFNLGAAAAVAIPNRYLSTAFYAKMSMEGVTLPNVNTTDLSDPIAVANNTTMSTVSLGLMEAGVAFAGYTNFLGQNMTIGITPKIQSYLTYTHVAAINNFDFKDFDKNKTTDNAFNVDVGAVWFYGPWRFAAAGKNLIKNEIETKKIQDPIDSNKYHQYNYELTPTYTAGVAFMTNYFILTADMDLNEQERFVGLDDNVQMFRAGAEVDLLYQIQLRGGYKKDLAGTYDDAFTAGIGFSPLNMFHFDLAAIYSIDSTYGVSLNMAYEY
ncbi:type IX secretion system membrane protein PorP/SprF [Aliivibrio finisterrensis]|uniref:Type IX secretion system membrane protein PorP/SprF n=1 Tax=Aliivibrio finisterrensis TaxID=511998 RepID=A0A4Q5KKY6_9GAMM|nr:MULTISPECIES: conjugal transfer protein TraF [Aliivibrio]MDD9175863.1 conjugal transfer protein TraF [Aliivibrio sp. S3TY1]MDD9192883.1 conjugal transfer protein TraF [Aliivibrio sp. S2TY2]RYU45987.1 type IX secretion system membrane protein PorP/SprF [Aliivibrio finisterrensis]